MSSLFKKRNRKFRQRETRSDSEDESISSEMLDNKTKSTSISSKPSTENENSKVSVSISSKDKDDKTDVSLPKVTKLLSFHDEEEESTEVFKLRKSSHSRRLAKQRERERKQRELEAAKADQLEPNEDVKIVTKPLKFKAESNILAGDDIDDMEMGSDDEEDKDKPNPFKNLLQSGVIPDAATIYAMKKHRQMAREMGDYIPVEDPEKDAEKSRLIREDDNDRSDDDDDEPSRINFTVNTGAVERQKIRETFLSLQEDPSNELEKEEAAELDRWEREQIKKGVGTIDAPQVLESQIFDSPIESSSFTSNHNNIHTSVPSCDLLTNNEPTLTTADIKSRIEERLLSLKNLHLNHEQELEECQNELISTSELIENLSKEAPLRSRNFALYQQMSGYVKDLVECFDVKLAHIDLLDGRMIELYKNRTQKMAARRQLDVQDQSEEYSSISSEILRGVKVEFLADKFSTDEARMRRNAEREGRKMRRRKRRERATILVKHQDGMSSDDEEPDSEILEFKKARENILREADTIFEDVVEDFGTLEGVISNFENWKYTQITSYCEAFVPLCLPKIFGTFVKLALLDWNPLKEERDFENMSWFHPLIFYGLDYDRESKTEDPDINLVPGVMERIILPKITAYIQNVWNPISQSETTRLVKLLQNLGDNYPSIHGKSKQLQNCLKSVDARIQKSLDDDIFIPLYPKELLENRSLGASDYFQRQVWFSIKFMQNIIMFEGLIAEQPLQHLALTRLLNRYLLMGLHTSIMMRDTLDKCKAIVSCLPKSWLQNTNSSSTHSMLKQFSTFLLKYADSIYSISLKKITSDDDVKDLIKDIVQLLAIINAMDDAVSLAKKYSVSAYKNV